MTETQYTEKDLQNMADQLLREADQQQHEIEEEVIKGNKGRLDEKTIASLPAAQLIQNNERLKELFVKGKRHGKLESSELSDVLDTMDLESEKLDMIYDSLDKLSIEITAEAFLPDVTSETEPPLDEIAEIEEEELVDPNSLVDSFNIDDPVRMYLKEIGKVSLLSAEGEVELASAIAAGNKAKATLIAWEKANGQDVEPLLDAEDPVGEIEISDEEIEQRMTGRRTCIKCGATYHVVAAPPKQEGICDKCGSVLEQRKDDQPETVKHRLEVYHAQTEVLKDFYSKLGKLVLVEGNQSIEQANRDILEAIGASV